MTRVNRQPEEKLAPGSRRNAFGRRAAVWAAAIVAGALAAACVFETRTEAPKVLFMGNSITLNQPVPELGWNHAWGMAASARDSDYVHQTVRLLAERGLAVEVHLADRDCPDCDGAIDEQIHNLDQVERLKPRYVIVQLSEHSQEIELRSGKMTEQYRRLLQGLAALEVPHVYCLGSWGEIEDEGPYAQAIHYAVRDFPGVRYLSIRHVSADSSSYGDTALFSNPGVLWHPGDKGMLGIARVIADAIWEDR